MSTGLYSDASGLSLGNGLYKNRLGLFSSASGLVTGYLPTPSLALSFATSQYSLNGLNYTDPAAVAGYTFTRASGGYAETTDGSLTYFASGVPRITNKGYLSEEARTNILSYSQDYSNAYWTKNNVTLTSTNNIAPDGTSTATLITATATFAQIRRLALAVTGGSTYTFSIFAKAGNFNVFTFVDEAAGFNVTFTLTGSGSSNLITGLSWTSPSATITALANGWYRCTFTATAPVGATTINLILWTGIYSGTDYTGNSFYAWGFQVEAGAFATSYIPTTTAAATRAADVLRYSGISFVSSSFTLAATGNYNQIHTGSASSVLASLSNNTFSNAAYIDVEDGFNRLGFIVRSGGSAILNALPAYTPPPLSLKTALRVDASTTMRGAFNGTLSGSATGANPIGMNSLSVGITDWANAQQFNGYIKSATIYPTALTDAQLQAITT